jgi:hypothetical protein
VELRGAAAAASGAHLLGPGSAVGFLAFTQVEAVLDSYPRNQGHRAYCNDTSSAAVHVKAENANILIGT